MQKFELVLLIHAHQPVGNFNEVFERAYATAYLPFIQVVERHPQIRLGLHYSGPLLEWIEEKHPEYFVQIRELGARGQTEIVGGGFFEPILVAIPPSDREKQIGRLADYVEGHFGARPRGAWLAERVWEPQLASTLSNAGMEYTLVDDNHFLGAGFCLDQLYGHFISEDLGRAVRVLPGLKILRYLIPFHDVGDTIEFLRRAADSHPGGFAVMGDDMEKFGIWPGTYDLCYRNGWLERFFDALERNSDWLALSTPREAISSHTPLGRADLPACSYTEMTEWSLPTAARARYHSLLREFSNREDVLSFLRGGIWRGFFSKYSEANLLHKKMLHVSRKIDALSQRRTRNQQFKTDIASAETLLLRGQCNDSYWHGVFGGLYSPHLRTAAWQALAAAETVADRLGHRTRNFADATTFDFDADGQNEVYLTSDRYAALVSPADGGTVSALDFRPSNVTLINSLQRRPEAYHARLRETAPGQQERVQSIHEQMRAKEGGLERWLHYDRWRRSSFRLLLFGREKSFEDYATLRLEEDALLAAGHYRVMDSSAKSVAVASPACGQWSAEKAFAFEPIPGGFTISCDMRLRRKAAGSASVYLGMEVVVNFLAPFTPDRYFEFNGQQFPLRWTSAVSTTELRVADEWQKVAVQMEAPNAREFWVAPIETVSESEDGFERIYQGSQVLALWPVELSEGADWSGRLQFEVTQIV